MPEQNQEYTLIMVVNRLQGLLRQLHQFNLIAVGIVQVAFDALGKAFLHRGQCQTLGSQLSVGLGHIIHMKAQVLEGSIGVVNGLVGVEQLNELILAHTQINAVNIVTLEMLLKHLGKTKVIAVKIHRAFHV